MANCKVQEEEAIMITRAQIELAIKRISGSNMTIAMRDAKRVNNEAFFGEPVMLVKESTDSKEGYPEIYENPDKSLIERVIQKKIARDDEMQLIKDTQDRIEELERGENLYFNDMPASRKPTYNEFDYDNVLSEKMFLQVQYDYCSIKRTKRS